MSSGKKLLSKLFKRTMYSINAPSSIRSNADYNVAVTLHEGKNPAAFNIKISGPEFSQEEEVKVEPFSTEVVSFKIPKISEGEYKITAQGIDEIYFKKTKSINYTELQRLFVFMQTDKATYKPGDLVRFRVLFLDNDTRPAKLEHPIHLSIEDGEQNLLKDLKGIEIKNGVYSDSYQLTEFASLGHWKLTVKKDDEGEYLESKSFEVAKYVLPKFDVKVETPSDISVLDEIIKINIRSNYTYGKPVTGKATITAKAHRDYYRAENEPKIFGERSVDITGKATVEFHLKDDLNYCPKSDYYNPPIEVSVSVEEDLSGIKQTGTAEIRLHRTKYKIEAFELPNSHRPDEECEIKVAVKKYDDTPIIDSKNPVILIAEDDRDNNITKYEVFLDEKGIATFKIKFPVVEKNLTGYSLKARYDDFENWIGHISQYAQKTGEYLDLEVETKKPVTYKDVEISLKSNKPLGSFVYHVVKKGEIIKTESVLLDESETSSTILLKPTFSMAPNVKVVVFLYNKGDLKKKEVTVNFEKELENQFVIDACDEAKPGQEVELSLKTAQNSFIGLLGLDQSVLLLKSGNDLEASNIFNKIEQNFFGGCFRGGCFPPRSSSSLIIITNADFEQEDQRHYPKMYAMRAYSPMSAQPMMFGSAESVRTARNIEPPRIRKEFPETWIWEDIETTKSDNTIIKKVVPDTMTSWVLTGFALNNDNGLAITKEAKKLKVFQPFFVSMNLPYSIKRGEVISVPVSVFNYMENEVAAEVTLENVDDEFEFVGGDLSTKSVSVSPEVGKNVVFKIKAKKVGQITLKVKAVSPVAGDIVHQMLRVEPEGVTEYVNKAVLIELNDKPEHKMSIDIEVPEEAVSDSTHVDVSLVGDILGPVIKNLDKLVRKPYGCGEQNMVNFVPNILVLHYLQSTNQLNEAIERKAKKFLEIGYERQLSYKHKNGSYSAFGQSSCNFGSTWLTAYVARSFHQAKPYTFIAPEIIESALQFLVSTQQENGSFKESGKLFDSHHDNEKDKGVALTAFVLLAFLENKESLDDHKEVVEKGLKFLVETIDTIHSLYSESIATYALAKAKHESAAKALAKLEGKATKDGDKKSWIVKKAEGESKPKRWCWWPQTYDVEVTSYAFLAFADQQTLEEMLPTIKWLISQRNSNGGFSSTQDTVMGLQALTKFAEKCGAGNSEMQIDFQGDKGSHGTFTVNKENLLLLQTHILNPLTTKVEVSAKGKGSSLLQVSYRFNLDDKNEKPAFAIKPLVKICKDDMLILTVVSNYQGGAESNMAVLEVSLPSGYIADKDGFANILIVERVKKVETKNEDTVIVIYFESLTEKDVSVDIAAIRTHEVDEMKKSAVQLYDYYDNSKVAKEFYNI